MAEHAGTPPDSVATEPAAEPALKAVDFYQTLRRLECTHRSKPRVGEAARVTDEPMRLAQRPTLGFEARQIVDLVDQGEAKPKRVEVSFFGAFGPHGPLPLHLTEYAHQRIHQSRDFTFVSFLNIFHHRLLTFFYRSWANAQPTVHHDRPHNDRFSKYVGAIIGQGARPPGARDTDLDRFALYMATHFSGQTRHPEGLAKVLTEYFGATAEVEEFIGEWLRIPDEYCWRINKKPGLSAEPLGKLGMTTRVGRRVWERQFKFRVVLGPLSRDQYERLMPQGADLPRLIALVRRYAGSELSWDVRLIMNEPDMEPTRLGKGARLGRTAYLVRGTVSRDKRWQDFVFDPMAQAG